MPYTFFAPDSRVVGSGNPPLDINNTQDILAAMGGVYHGSNTAYSGGVPVDLTGATDITAPFTAAMAAAIAGNGAELLLAPGIYNLNTGSMGITGPLKIRGLGTALSTGGALVPAVTLNCNGAGGAGSMFTTPYQGYLWTGLNIENVAINYTGTGDIFHQFNTKGPKFRDCSFTHTGNAGSIFQTSGAVSVLNAEWDRCSFGITNATRSVPMITLSSNASGSVSNNTFRKCYFSNAGFNNTQYMVYIDCTGGAGAYHYMEVFDSCWFENPFGGCVKSLSGMAVTIEKCTVWDIFSGQGQTVGNSMYYLGAFAGGSGSQQSRIMGCSRNRNGPDGSATWDVYAEATTCGTLIEGYTTKPDTASTPTHVYFNFNSHPDVQLIGNQSPQGLAVNGNSTTIVTNPSFSSAVLGSGASPGYLDILNAAGWTPMDSGYQTWNFDPALINTQTAIPTGGVVNLFRVNVRRAFTATNVLLHVGTLGATLTAGQNFAGLYNSAGTLIAATADQTATWNTGGSTGFKSIPLAGGPYALAAGYYWVAVMCNGTTGPAFGRTLASSGSLINAGVDAAHSRWATNGTGTTAFPTPITPASNVNTVSVPYFAGIS